MHTLLETGSDRFYHGNVQSTTVDLFALTGVARYCTAQKCQ